MNDFYADDNDFDSVEAEVEDDFDAWMDAMLAGPA